MGERVNCQINHTTTGKSFYTNEFPRSVFLCFWPYWCQQRNVNAVTGLRITHTIHIILTVLFLDIFPAEGILDVSNTVTNTLTGWKPTTYCSRGLLFNASVMVRVVTSEQCSWELRGCLACGWVMIRLVGLFWLMFSGACSLLTIGLHSSF